MGPQAGNLRNLVGIRYEHTYLPGSLCSYQIPTTFLGFPVWGTRVLLAIPEPHTRSRV